MTSLTDLLEVLEREFKPEEIKPERMLTSKRRYSGWLKDRVKLNQQLLLTALICPPRRMRDRLDDMERQLYREFEGFARVKVLPYPYNNIETMKQHIGELMKKYEAKFSLDDVLDVVEKLPGEDDEVEGYLVLTIVSSPVIV